MNDHFLIPSGLAEITASVSIREQCIRYNQEEYFRGEGDTQHWVLEAYKKLDIQYPKFFKMDLLCKLGFIAAEILLRGKNDAYPDAYRKAMVLQNSQASLSDDILYQESTNSIPSPALFVYTLPNIVMGELSIRHRFKGENTFFISEKKDFTQLSEYVHLLLTDHVADLILTGYVDFSETTQDVELFLVERI